MKAVYHHSEPGRRPVARFGALLFALVDRDLRAKYRRSSLGMSWAFLKPLILMVLFNILRGVVDISSDGIPYLLFSYTGLVPWTFFSTAVAACGVSVTDNAEILKKISLPREVFPLAGVMTALFDFAMAAILLAGMIVWYGVPVGWTLLWVPVLVFLAAVIAFGLGLLIAGLGTFRRDVVFAVPFILQAWLFVTPVIYPMSSVPSEWYAWYLVNPMVGVVEGFRSVLLKASSPPLDAIAVSAIVSALVLAVAWPVFRWLSAYFADVL